MAFTRTTAVMSIMGYMLGLGDRHLENINVDTTTGQECSRSSGKLDVGMID